MTNRFLRITTLLAGLTLLAPLAGLAGTPLPDVHEPEGECVEEEDVMRRDHMNFILHQRDETMHRGIRTSKYSFAECIDCHVQPDENGNIASFESEEHFCTTCHQYAAVSIDCFDCHADRPQKFIERGGKSTALRDQLQLMLTTNDDMGGASK